MKASIRIIAVGLVASLAVVSCAKQEAKDNADSVGGVRTIAVSFANASVKSALGEDGLTPKFVANDVIKVSNGSAAEYCFVSIDGSGNAFITTSLTGSLTMVYPSTAAKMNGNAIDGILVPTVQDGTFASANICKATIEDDATSATFANQTALFKVTPPSGVKQFTITSLKPVVDGVARTGTAVAINTEGADDAAKLVITAGGDASSLTTFFVSLVAGANLTDLSFEYMTDETHGAMKGIPTKSIQSPDEDVTAPSTLYTIDANNWHDYVVLAGKKWATMNVGATTPDEYGEYSHGERSRAIRLIQQKQDLMTNTVSIGCTLLTTQEAIETLVGQNTFPRTNHHIGQAMVLPITKQSLIWRMTQPEPIGAAVGICRQRLSSKHSMQLQIKDGTMI